MGESPEEDHEGKLKVINQALEAKLKVEKHKRTHVMLAQIY